MSNRMKHHKLVKLHNKVEHNILGTHAIMLDSNMEFKIIHRIWLYLNEFFSWKRSIMTLIP